MESLLSVILVAFVVWKVVKPLFENIVGSIQNNSSEAPNREQELSELELDFALGKMTSEQFKGAVQEIKGKV